MFEHTFNARYTDVDFRRILKENTDASFIKVYWKSETRGDYLRVLLTKKGLNRLRAVGLDDHVIYGYSTRLKLDARGLPLSYSSEANMHQLGPFGAYDDMETVEDCFSRVYSDLLRLEEQENKIRVQSIY